MDLLFKEDKVYTIQEVLNELFNEKSELSAIVNIVKSKLKYRL